MLTSILNFSIENNLATDQHNDLNTESAANNKTPNTFEKVRYTKKLKKS